MNEEHVEVKTQLDELNGVNAHTSPHLGLFTISSCSLAFELATRLLKSVSRAR